MAQAKAALSGQDGVFHVVARVTTSEAGRPAKTVWMQTWAAAEGRRSRSLVYTDASDGGRGRLFGEQVSPRRGPFDAVIYPGPGGTIFPDEPAAERPSSYVLDLLRRGKVKDKSRVDFAGREAWRFRIERRVEDSNVVYGGARSRAPDYTERTVLMSTVAPTCPSSCAPRGLRRPCRAGGERPSPRRQQPDASRALSSLQIPRAPRSSSRARASPARVLASRACHARGGRRGPPR